MRAVERARPEHLAEHRGVLEQGFLGGGQPVDPRSDQSLHGLGERQVVTLMVGEHPRVLGGVERVSLGTAEHRLLRLGVEDRAVEDVRQEFRRLDLRQRRDRKRRRVALAAAPAGAPVE